MDKNGTKIDNLVWCANMCKYRHMQNVQGSEKSANMIWFCNETDMVKIIYNWKYGKLKIALY